MNNNFEVKVKSFNELNVDELYEIVKARYEVFVCEQEITCENDFDDKDKECLHLFIIDKNYNGNKIVGYCRLLPKGLSYEEASIGRVLVTKQYRRSGIGKEMMNIAIENIKDKFDTDKIVLSAQSYIKDLYLSVGFKQISDEYEEAKIPHVKMIYRI